MVFSCQLLVQGIAYLVYLFVHLVLCVSVLVAFRDHFTVPDVLLISTGRECLGGSRRPQVVRLIAKGKRCLVGSFGYCGSIFDD